MLESKAGVATAGVPPVLLHSQAAPAAPADADMSRLSPQNYQQTHKRQTHTTNKSTQQKPNSDKSPSNAARTRTRTQCNSVSQLLAATTHARICLKTNPSSSFQPESKHVPTACAVEQLKLELRLKLRLKLECACVGVYANAAQLIE